MMIEQSTLPLAYWVSVSIQIGIGHVVRNLIRAAALAKNAECFFATAQVIDGIGTDQAENKLMFKADRCLIYSLKQTVEQADGRDIIKLEKADE